MFVRYYSNLWRNLQVILFGFLISAGSIAQGESSFNVTSASFTMQDGLLLLNSTIEIELPQYINKAIDQGFAVPLMFEVEVLEYSPYWFDKKLLSLKQQYQLHFLPMLSSYAIFDVNANERLYFNSRQQAVRHLKVVYAYPMFDISNINQSGLAYVRIRSGIDVDELPLPLKSSSLWDNDWELESDWFEWDIAPSQ
jgi:hypothetical protein|tara:strand:+ start:249 stop:836 length:588 start_codon:yes stop_codon:yes gene_type:complete